MNDATDGPKQNGNRSQAKAARRGLWRWFLAGFAVVFVGMSLAITMYPLLPSGRGVFSCPLWRYYLVEARHAINSSGAMGPASGSGTAVMETLFQHVLYSSIGGGVMVGFGWAVRRFKARQRHA